MIKFNDIEDTEPYSTFLKIYNEALVKNQKNIDASIISSFDKTNQEVDSRFVNIKYLTKNEWTFFSNYNSPKAIQFNQHDQISSVFYWDTLNIQIRMRSKIYKSSKAISDTHFNSREHKKNALSISSMQSRPINNYADVVKKYNKVLNKKKLSSRPLYWGGFSFVPYFFEFFEGHESRINKRTSFELNNGIWKKYTLEP
jgi:pyridoxamine 5'-phosphate oxidase